MSFTGHVLEAIKINYQRRKIYSRLTDGKSHSLSNRLIFYEISILPLTFLIDFIAFFYQLFGIPIVKNDFVSLSDLPEPTIPPRFRNSASSELIEEIENLLCASVKSIYMCLNKKDHEKGLLQIHGMIENIKYREEQNKTLFPMTIHILESIFLIFSNGIEYSKRCKGCSFWLTKSILQLHFLGLKRSVQKCDVPAQKIHSLNVGIIVNDVPQILKLY